mmetsp:Transcript_33981/g.33123  ORF Transcript_33981/g.33123 Transcript_33981/m.33123 type:complete len:227 (+) Transcript_33981:1140-1820(+)
MGNLQLLLFCVDFGDLLFGVLEVGLCLGEAREVVGALFLGVELVLGVNVVFPLRAGLYLESEFPIISDRHVLPLDLDVLAGHLQLLLLVLLEGLIFYLPGLPIRGAGVVIEPGVVSELGVFGHVVKLLLSFLDQANNLLVLVEVDTILHSLGLLGRLGLAVVMVEHRQLAFLRVSLDHRPIISGGVLEVLQGGQVMLGEFPFILRVVVLILQLDLVADLRVLGLAL